MTALLDPLMPLLNLLPLAAESGASGGAADYPLWSVAALVSLLTLTILEIVLGIDNVVFIAILTDKLPQARRLTAWRLGLGLAMLMRIGLLFVATWVVHLDKSVLFNVPTFGLVSQNDELAAEVAEARAAGDTYVMHHGDEVAVNVAASEAAGKVPITGKRLILLIGGLFLLFKAVYEIHDKLEGHEEHGPSATKAATATFTSVIVQILLLDAVFSIDSVITAVGIADHLTVMIIAVVVAVGVMIAFAKPISRLIEKHPTLKMLALSFLILIGMMLVAEGMGQHIPKGYIYFAMAFGIGVELLNIRLRKLSKPVKLKQSYVKSESRDGYGDVAAE